MRERPSASEKKHEEKSFLPHLFMYDSTFGLLKLAAQFKVKGKKAHQHHQKYETMVY